MFNGKLWRHLILMTSYEEMLNINAKTSVNVNWFLFNLQDILAFGTSRCSKVTVFGEHRNSLTILNDGPKFVHFAYFCNISLFYSDLKKKNAFVISTTLKCIIFVCLKVTFRFIESTSGLKENVNIFRTNHMISMKSYIKGYENII